MQQEFPLYLAQATQETSAEQPETAEASESASAEDDEDDDDDEYEEHEEYEHDDDDDESAPGGWGILHLVSCILHLVGWAGDRLTAHRSGGRCHNEAWPPPTPACGTAATPAASAR